MIRSQPVRVLALWIGLFAAGHGVARGDENQDPLAELRAEARRVLRLPKAKAKPRLGVPLLYAERAIEKGDTKAATPVLNQIVKIDPWAMEAHLLLARMQMARGEEKPFEKRAAEKKLAWILEHAETDVARTGALRALGQPADTTIPAARPLPGTDVRISIVPIGQVDLLLIKAAAEQVAKHIEYPVDVQDARLDLPPGGNNPLEAWTEKLRTQFKPVLDRPEGDAALQQAGRNRGELQSDDAFLQVYRAWLLGTARWHELSDFDGAIHESAPRIWDPNDMTRHLARALSSFSRENVNYVGVTRGFMLGQDWRGKERPVYGWGGKDLAVASYGRFLAAETREKPNWQQLLDSTTKQLICVVGTTFDVGRCPDPKCPMHAVFDVASLRAKGFKPCPRCSAIMYGSN